MADVVPNSKSASMVTIKVDNEDSKEENSNDDLPENNVQPMNKSAAGDTKKHEKEKNSESSKSLLRPSALSQNAFKFSSLSSTSNPFLKLTSSNKFGSAEDDSLFNVTPKPEKTEVKAVTPTLRVAAPVPLSNPNYVFGQNIGDRVADKVESVSNGTGTLLFSSVASAVQAKGNGEKSEVENGSKESSSLIEDAARCQEQRSAKRKYEEVQVTTGEEEEENVLQITVKLFAFEGGSWVERGRGTLRLNDNSVSGRSRIVVRTMGNLRVVLNTKIWAGMELSRASDRSIRTTAMDPSGTVKIFLIQASPSDITTLFNYMEMRVDQCKMRSTSGDEPKDLDSGDKVETVEKSAKSQKIDSDETVVTEDSDKTVSNSSSEQDP